MARHNQVMEDLFVGVTKEVADFAGFRLRYVKMNPALAGSILDEHNVGNRNRKSVKIEQISHDMLRGHWKPKTGEGIKFDKNNVLTDGQNRLEAVVASGCTVEMLVFEELAPDVAEFIDQGVKRTGADALWFNAGIDRNRDALASALRMMAAWENGYLRTSNIKTSRYNVSNADIVELNLKHEGMAEAVDWAYRVRRRVPTITPSVLAFTRYITDSVDVDDSEKFWSGIAEHATQGKGDPRLALMDMCQKIDADADPSGKSQGSFVWAIFTAWNAWRNGQTLNRLNWRRAVTNPETGSKEWKYYTIPTPD